MALLLSLRFGESGSFNFSGNFLIYWIIWCGGAVLAELLKRGHLPQWKTGHGVLMALLLAAALLGTLKSVPVAVQHLTWAAFYFLLMLWGLVKPDGLRLPGQIKKPLLSFHGIYCIFRFSFVRRALAVSVWQQASQFSDSVVLCCAQRAVGSGILSLARTAQSYSGA